MQIKSNNHVITCKRQKAAFRLPFKKKQHSEELWNNRIGIDDTINGFDLSNIERRRN